MQLRGCLSNINDQSGASRPSRVSTHNAQHTACYHSITDFEGGGRVVFTEEQLLVITINDHKCYHQFMFEYLDKTEKREFCSGPTKPVSYTHLTLPTNREV
eukprot:TRINITY_DN3362_c0_g1_i13.p1 TRINITY_DN3362_c0_g1~~TRINITY_DN3362_c0_g1_i13.p1  ORF type:complete len:101 (+),score=8.63 TRINITY_DN3362_c0_g1_i13:341-643(+)